MNKKSKNKFTVHRPRIRSRHPSHNVLRPRQRNLPLLPFKSLIRLGSTTEVDDEYMINRVELNSIEAIKNSSNKLWMKQCFTEDKVKTADWWSLYTLPENDAINNQFQFYREENEENIIVSLQELPYPIISKHKYGSRGRGNVKHNSAEDLKTWLESKDNLNNYIFEKFYNYNREYRLHVTEDGCFYTCRKMLRSNTPENERWFRNDSNSSWILENNPSFDKPVNWDSVIKESVKALKAVGLDFGAVDLRIQSANNRDGELREDPKFIVVEINSAPSFGTITAQKYIEELPNLLTKKYNQ